jgi:excisionase family DNA binding protein
MDVWRDQNLHAPKIEKDEYTVDDLAELLGISREAILHDVETGDLVAERSGREVVGIRREAALAWLNRRGPGV